MLQLRVVMQYYIIMEMLQLGVVMLEQNRHEDALNYFELALRMNPKHKVCIGLGIIAIVSFVFNSSKCLML